ncbi:thioredoxin family protein [uncultured Clostridium sp.]|jgi:thiol-disulfide isomerase/thioredoxin|uniref:thioredoxin family protein n=1 Tax=uncultured Clostridium sp. TaxID=59620 RepID=UPI002626EA9D|nr:thioredoxin family protein [uncultured Clostridium sp.]
MRIYIKEEVQSFIDENIISIVYFSGESCNVCPVIKGRVNSILENYKGVSLIDIDASSNRELSASYDIFSIPVLLLFVDGKEALRFGRNIDFMEFEKSLDRYYNLIF